MPLYRTAEKQEDACEQQNHPRSTYSEMLRTFGKGRLQKDESKRQTPATAASAASARGIYTRVVHKGLCPVRASHVTQRPNDGLHIIGRFHSLTIRPSPIIFVKRACMCTYTNESAWSMVDRLKQTSTHANARTPCRGRSHSP